MFRASLCPSSGEQQQDCLKSHVVMPGCAGCGRVEPGRRQCAQPDITTCGFKQSCCSPDDGHNDARNMLRVN
jgi:hypothetical protein